MVIYSLFFSFFFFITSALLGAVTSADSVTPNNLSVAQPTVPVASPPVIQKLSQPVQLPEKSFIVNQNIGPTYPVKPSLVSIIKGDVASVFVDGKDMTEEVRKLIGYTIGWNFGNLGKSWMNGLFQFDPYKSESKYLFATYLFSDGSMISRGPWKEDKFSETVYQKPFVVLEARYGRGQKGKFFMIDVTRHFQLGTKMVLSDAAIKLEKDPSIKARLSATLQALKVSKNIMLMKKGEQGAKAVTYNDLLKGWPIETTSYFPGAQVEQTVAQNPGWKQVGAVDRLLANPMLSITAYNPNRDKERAAAKDLPMQLKAIENENKLLDVEAQINTKKKK